MWCIIVSKYKLEAILMNKRVEEFLANSENKSVRDQILIEAGLYDKIFLPEANENYMSLDEKTRIEYSESEYDSEKGTTVHFKKQPIEVTDEEFKAIVQHSNVGHSNTLANTIAFCAYAVLIAGFMAGIFIGSEIGFLWAFIVWIIMAVSGISMLWFAEVLKLLQSIKNQLQKSAALSSCSSQNN